MFLKELMLVSQHRSGAFPVLASARDDLSFTPVRDHNFAQWIKLRVQPAQKPYTYDLSKIIKQAYWNQDGANWDIYLITTQGHAIGTFTCCTYPDLSDRLNFGGFLIDKTYQGKGFGRLTLEKLVTWLPQIYPTKERIMLDVDPRNRVAVKLYRTVGFRYCGWRPPFYRVYERSLVNCEGEA